MSCREKLAAPNTLQKFFINDVTKGVKYGIRDFSAHFWCRDAQLGGAMSGTPPH